ncbi:MAG TPA: rhodanese-like domain-containing protein [Denitromonas sp.]|uniref:rhodanese-like domain-containing protein n=1 Tax=Denitromonas sp. TaxID=2734609 RepID=UPI001DC8C61D|nr:rhodanese-like domain-containing protein [Rhodocyclaceae bacterium]MCP5223170.1 rhodanese-like domain-containing protein [Zoogloeaceae bacterium]HQU89270.1 rhodanese-like domain-containing protein [Denitromonas sp.]HQV15953.1 rhodanese-like domain-containing protein [Denitromonas sp.]
MRTWLIAALAGLSFSAVADTVNIDDATLERLRAEGVPVVDIRTAPEWQQTGIVPGSHLLTFFDNRGEAEPEAWLARLQAIAKPGQPVVLICRSGNRSTVVSRFLTENAGYAKVYNVESGIRGWVKAQRPVVKAVEAASTCERASAC